MRLDILDVARARLEEAGLREVRATSQVDARRTPESVSVFMGAPAESVGFYDMEWVTTIRLTVVCRRLSEADAMADAGEAHDALRRGDLSSENGSYELLGVEVSEPRPVLWDESGRTVWCVEANVEIKREDF